LYFRAIRIGKQGFVMGPAVVLSASAPRHPGAPGAALLPLVRPRCAAACSATGGSALAGLVLWVSRLNSSGAKPILIIGCTR
jgi:hypothetical protein